MNEYEEKKMSYGFWHSASMTVNRMFCIEQGAQVLISHYGGGCTRGWLLGESDDFKESGCYDIVIPDEGIDPVHWDHLHAITVYRDREDKNVV